MTRRGDVAARRPSPIVRALSGSGERSTVGDAPLVASPTSGWILGLVVTAVATLPALLLGQAPLAVVLAVAALVAAGLAVGLGPDRAGPLVLALVPATVLANSALLPSATYFVPAAIAGLALILVETLRIVRGRGRSRLPSRGLLISAAVYIGAAALATIVSIRPTTSLPYLVGIVTMLAATLWLGPRALERSAMTASFLVLIGAAGVAVTLISLVLSATGPIPWSGHWLGVYLVDELTVSGRPTGLLLLRTTGPFLAPGIESLVLAPAVLALLAIRPGLDGRSRQVVTVAIAIVVIGLLSTLARTGWLSAIVGCVILVAASLRARRLDLASAAVLGVLALAFGALLTNVVGADYRPDLTEARTPAAVIETGADGPIDAVPLVPDPGAAPGASPPPGGEPPRYQTRGGSELSGRLEIWGASVRAIRDSPILGYGPGTNAIVLDPYLSGESRRFVGLTSHNTWLRTWIELGLGGILAFVGLVIVTLVVGGRRVLRGRASSIEVGALAIFAGLTAAQAFETLLLGGVSLPSVAWALAAGLLTMAGSRAASEGSSVATD
jgi:hypothetical protein